MDLPTVAAAFTGGMMAGGTVLTAHWLWLRPKVRQTIQEEIKQCQLMRDGACKAAYEAHLTRIEQKIDAQARETTYIRQRLDIHIDKGGGCA